VTQQADAIDKQDGAYIKQSYASHQYFLSLRRTAAVRFGELSR
jgi:hypothetical protein